MTRLITLITLLCLAGTQVQAQLITSNDAAITATESGQVQGYISNDIFTFKGVPYGQAERFATATKAEPWEGIRSSRTYGPVAPLLTSTTPVPDEAEFVFDHDWGYTGEDCLVLNVWTPSIDDGKKRPVMFWIHGGGFVSGSSQELPSYDGERLARTGDVVVVSINHRLNVLGFLDLSAYGEEFATSANNSILDMKLALEWVQTNIENFGGDPDNVTIFGQSGGGAKVNTLMAMPAAQGLFHKAINMSGSFRQGLLTRETTQKIAAKTLAELGIEAAEVDKIKEVPFAELSAAATRALKAVEVELKAEGQDFGQFGLNWEPSMDGKVLLHQPLSDEAMALSKDIPLMIGSTKNEFTSFFMDPIAQGGEVAVMGYLRQQYGDRTEEYIAAVKEAYPETHKPVDLITVDMVFRPGAVHQANKKSALAGGAPVYMYLFTWESPVMNGKYKSLHCLDIPFAFNTIGLARQMTGATPEAHALAPKVSQAYLNFARTGNPNHAGLPDWPAYDEAKGATMMLDNDCEVRYHPDKTFLDFHRKARR